MCASNWNSKIEYKQKTIYKYEVLLSLPPSYTIHEDFFIKRNYLLSRLINAIFDNFARTGETQKKEGLPFLVAKSSTQQEVMTPSLYIVGYNNNVVFYLTEVVGKMCFRPRGVVPFDSYTDGGHTTSTTRAFSLCSAAFFRDILCI